MDTSGSSDVCPFCGGKPIKKNPYHERITEIDAGVEVAEVSGKGSAKIKPNPQKEEYYLCNGCNAKYVWASLDIDLIIQHLDGEENIARLISHYYCNKVTLVDLLSKYRTGIVRRYSDTLPYVSTKIAKR